MRVAGRKVFDARDARHDLVDVPSRPRSRLMDAYSGTKFALRVTACAH